MKKTEKKSKKNKPVPKYTPVFINSANTENQVTLFFRLVIKVFLVCLSASGLGLTLAQIYRIPVSTSQVVFTCFVTVAILNIILMYFRKRVLFIPVTLFLLLTPHEETGRSIALFYNHMLHILDSRLLSTARYSGFTMRELEIWYNQRGIVQVFLALCIVISLVFTIGSRSRFIGIMLITTVFFMTPAFGSEIAGYVPGMNVLISGMLGVYAMWVAHAWENLGGIHQINYSNKERKNQLMPDKPETNELDIAGEVKKPHILKMTPGSLPYFYKYSRNSIAAGILALCAALIAATAVPQAVKFDYQEIINTIRELPVRIPDSIQRFFKHNFGSINDNGFFGNSSDISTGINMGNPPTGNIPIIRISVEDDSEKLYFRGGIGIDLTGQEWSMMQDSPEYARLLELLESFSPELEYHVFRQKQQIFHERSFGHSRLNSIIGHQNVRVEYLARTGFLLLPTQPYNITSIKNNRDFRWHGDTFIRPNRRVNSTNFEILYPRMENFHEFHIAYINMKHSIYDVEMSYLTSDGEIVDFDEFNRRYNPMWDWSSWNSVYDEEAMERFYELMERSAIERSRYEGITWDFPCNTTTADYNAKIAEYRELINTIYTYVPDEEIDNIDKYIASAGFTSHIPTGMDRWDNFYEDYYSHNTLGYIDSLEAVQRINDHLRRTYRYSLTTDNTSGSNTTIGTFLHETYAGHCAMYASAMVLAARRMGLPARYVTGIVTIADDGEESSFGYTQIMAERDFHAWVEVYFENIGWLPFDPTGGAHGEDGGNTAEGTNTPAPATTTAPVQTAPPPPVTTPNTAVTLPVTTPSVTATTAPEEIIVSSVNIGLIIVVIVLILIPIAFAGWVWSVFKRLSSAESKKFARYRSAGGKESAVSDEMAMEMYRFMFKLLKAEGVRVSSGEPPLEFGERTDREVPITEDISLDAIMPVFEKLEFSALSGTADVLTHDEYDAMYEYLHSLYGKVVLEKKFFERTVRRFKYGR
jgi:transglutaminase-like putative cysteine protease/phosphate/sulfate permease